MIRRIVHYTGHVQGVGFRATASSLAREFDVSGYVKNLDDGRVLLEAEGEKKQVEAFLAALAERMAGMIRDIRFEDRPATGHNPGFGIAH